MKLLIGTDRRGRIHSVCGVTATDAATHDITQMPDLLCGEEREIYGDRAYWKEADRQASRRRKVRHRVNRRAVRGERLREGWRQINRSRSHQRA